jgi:hypothetical protein
MSGNVIAYHLRQNKAIERNLFIELLRRVGYARNISEYQYIGFGGPFLEDYKQIHNALRITAMHSIERDENTHRRQNFNRPVSFINLHHCESHEFFRETLNTEKNSVVWLDYTAPKELGAQLNEFVTVAAKLGEFDVLKLTLNANPTSLGHTEAPRADRQSLRLQTLSERVGNFMPPSLAATDMTATGYPEVLLKCIQYAANSLSGRSGNLTFQPVASFKYSDGGHTMLTITGVMLRAGQKSARDFLRISRLKHWEFSNLGWDTPIEISVPSLSIKERLRVEEALPLSKRTRKPAEKLQKTLGFWPCKPSDANQMENYAKLYRSFPYFSKVNPT